MKQLILSLAMVFLILSGCTTSSQEIHQPFPQDITTNIQAEMDKLTASGQPTGMVVWIDTPQQRFSGASGYANLVEKSPMPPQGAFRIGSITKMFTATVVVQLAEQGILTLDDQLAQWLPEAADKLPYGDQITLRHLLTHTSGIFNIVENEAYYADLFSEVTINEETGSVSLDCVQRDPHDTLSRYVYGQDPLFPPGTQWHYSNSNYLLLGMVIEKAMGIPLAEAYRHAIYEPLGMTSTFLDCYEDPLMDVVDGYMKFGETLTNVTDLHESIGWSAGGLVSTASDLVIFARGLFGGALLEKPESLNAMTTPVSGASYGLGIAIQENSMGHAGGITGFRSVLQYIHSLDTVVVILYNNDAANPEQGLVDILAPAVQALEMET